MSFSVLDNLYEVGNSNSMKGWFGANGNSFDCYWEIRSLDNALLELNIFIQNRQANTCKVVLEVSILVTY